MVRLCESREITPQIYLFLLKYASFHKKSSRYLRIQKKCCTFAAQNFKTYTIRILFRCVNIQEGNAKANSSFSLRVFSFVEFEPAEFGFVEGALHLLVAGGGFGYRLRVGQAAGELLLQSRFLLLQLRHLLLQLR